MASDPLRFEVEDGLATLTLDRPDAKNAIDDALRDALIAALTTVGRDEQIRAAVLTATGDTFCPGADLFGARRDPAAPLHVGATRAMMKRNSQRLIRTVLDVEKPIVAAVNGVAAGMGAHLAFACDLVIVAAEARFIEVFVRRGLAVDAGGALLLARALSPHQAKELVFFGDALPAADALRLGLCNKVVPRAELATTAAAWGRRLANGPTFAIGLSKRLLNRAYESSTETCFEDEAYAQSLVAQSDDLREGMRAFVEKRPPAFRGR
jgi:2-(1,2-epoxy-1,2-dihydrophenyl)acetyl-CoA isomerase